MRINRKLCLVLGGFSVALSAAATLRAQGQAQQNQNGPTNAQAQGQQPQDPQAQATIANNNAQNSFYSGIFQTPWFGNPTVRQQLQLNEEQFNNLNNAYMQLFNQYNSGLNGIDRNLPEVQRAQRLQELNQRFSNEFSKSVDGSFADEAARQRFNQMHWQYRGYGAFNDPNVQKQLGLSDEQLQRLNQYQSDWNSQLSRWHEEYPNDRPGVSRSFREAQREAQNRINSTLTTKQQRMWADMVGKPMDWPADVYFPNTATSNTNRNRGSNKK